MYYNNNMYLYSVHHSLHLFGTPINRNRDNNNAPFKPSPFVAGNPFRASVLFDEDNKRFMIHRGLASAMTEASNLSLTVTPLVDDPDPGHPTNALFSWRNNIESLLYMGNYADAQGFAIYKDSELDRYRLIKFDYSAGNHEVKKLSGSVFVDNTLVESIKYFAMYPGNRNLDWLNGGAYLYMATDDKVYRVNPNMSIDDITVSVLQPGYKISVLKFVGQTSTGQWHQPELTVGSYDPNGKVGENGRLEIYRVDAGIGGTGNLIIMGRSLAESNNEMRIVNIGKPVDVGYRPH
jgi:hypothetical protein